ARRASRLANELGTLLPELAPGLAYSSDLFVRALMRRISSRMMEAARLATGRRIIGASSVQDMVAATAPPPPPPSTALPQPAIAMRMMSPSSDGGSSQGRGESLRRR
ncbi:hypothetical protein Vretimale_13240, partial [Volvox reticuliferus]